MDAKNGTNPLSSNPPSQFPTDSSEYTIGLALGSPKHAARHSSDAARVPRTMTSITSPANAAPEQPKATGLSRSLSKRLPFLGRSKSKRANTHGPGNNNFSRPSADLGTTNYVTTPMPSAVPSPPAATAARMSPHAGRTEVGRLKKTKPPVMRSVTDPQHLQSQHEKQLESKQPNTAWTPGQSGPLLDVEIPDIKLERYSVMFGGLLEQQQSTSGLLARRQATLTKLRAIEDEVRRGHYNELQRSRRVTSPAITPVYPPIAELAADEAPAPNVVPLRLRSNTFPMVIREAGLSQETISSPGQVDSPLTSMQSPGSQVSTRTDSEERPLLRSKFHKPSVESIRSPYGRPSGERENATALSPPPGHTWRGKDGNSGNSASPAYTTMPKPVDIPDRSTSLRNLQQPPPAAPKPHPKPTTREEALEDAAEVSIARQISISRQQRRLLEPLHEREMRRARANKHIKAASQISMDDGKRIAETKTGTPTFIHPERQVESPQHLYRRSERVTIEGL